MKCLCSKCEKPFEYKGKNLYFENEKPRWEALVLLNRDIREIFARFDKNTRNKIRKAVRSIKDSFFF